MARRRRKSPQQPHTTRCKYWWVRHGAFGRVQYGSPTNRFIPHMPAGKPRQRHFGMIMPKALYPTAGHLPVHRELIDLFPKGWFDDRS